VETSGVIILGGGGHARVVADCLIAQGTPLRGFCALENTPVHSLPYLGPYRKELVKEAKLIIAIGDNTTRMSLAREEQQDRFANAKHPSSIVSPHALMGMGCMILHNCIVQANARIGDHVILNTSCQVDHDCVINDFVHIGPGTVLCGNVKVGTGALVGAGATVLPGVSIGQWATIGAGSVVLRDIPDRCVAVGNPARLIAGKEL
jgi:sugar O-acyltransferase (sialic acid O-acetyltransferase NeuD family)